MASLDNTKINEIRFLNIFFDQRIKNKLSIYVEDLEKLEKIESNKRRCSMLIIIGSIIGYPLIWFVFNYLGYHFGFACFCLFIISCMVAINMSKQAELNTIKTIIYSFKQYVILELLHQQDTINFKHPLDEVVFSVFNDVLDEIHVFDSSIYITDHIGYTTDKQIKSVTFKNVDSEKLKKIINLNAITNFSYAPI